MNTMTTSKPTKKNARAMKMDEAAEAGDIIDLIERDHKPLKKLIKVMKSEDATLRAKKAAFKEFAPSLLAHAKPEEKTWYKDMKNELDMNVEGLEGDVEHTLADKLVAELKRTTNDDMFEAKVKVLAEMVEHHIEEEEEEMLPSYRRKTTIEERRELGAAYEKAREQYL